MFECSHHDFMATSLECICCKEINSTMGKISTSQATGTAIACITCASINGFSKFANFQHSQKHASSSSTIPLHEFVHKNSYILATSIYLSWRKYRYITEHQLKRRWWGYLDQNIRVILPACAVNKIRDTFPSHNYTRFHFPTLHYQRLFWRFSFMLCYCMLFVW